MRLKVTIDENAGPCGGVKRVIRLAEDSLQQGVRTTSLGDIIHNEDEIRRLQSLGLESSDHRVIDETVQSEDPRRVLIRAHGEPPQTFERARSRGVELIDGTCPVVTRSQNAARQHWAAGEQIVIVGKPMHAEVIGIVGHCGGEAIVVSEPADVERLDASRKSYVLAQTTISLEQYESVLREMERRGISYETNNTICRFVTDRNDDLPAFARQHDVILFVGGHHSSNTKVMHKVCEAVNPRSYHIDSVDEIKASWFEGAQSVGVSGSASTPEWLIADVARYVSEREW
jgi:4-hydroxy-3-methylbut-2-en-1-yl diphosphate reductase